MKYNHNRPLASFEDVLAIVKQHGFKPIAVSQIYMEDAFIFETEQESKLAYNTLKNIVEAWWYSKENFTKACDDYKQKFGVDVLAHFL